jgi:branched-chain amino acid transport system substrate-binding protein
MLTPPAFIIKPGYLAALGIIGIAGFGNMPAKAQEISKLDIGVVLPLSGPQAAYGQEMLRGMTLAVEQLTAAEPKLQGKLQLLTGDEKSLTSEAKTAASQLIEKQYAHILIGSITTPATAAAAAVSSKLHRPFISPLSTGRLISTNPPVGAEITSNGIYRLSLDDSSQGALLAKFALESLKINSAAILRDNTDSALSFAGGFTQAFQGGGGKLLATETYELGTENFTTMLTQIKEKNPPVLLIPAYFQTASLIMQQAKKLKLNTIFLGGDSWDTPELQKAAGNAAKGHYFIAQFATDDPTPTTAAFVEAFKAKYKREPGVIAALGYDSIALATDAMRRANQNAPTQLIRSLDRTQEFQGVSGVLSFNGKGDTNKTGVIKVSTTKGAVFKTRIGGPSGDIQATQAPSTKAKGH